MAEPATETAAPAAAAQPAGNGAAPAAAPAFAPPAWIAESLQDEAKRKEFEGWFPKAANVFTQPDFENHKKAEAERYQKLERERNQYRTAASLPDEAKANLGNYEDARQALLDSYDVRGVPRADLEDFPTFDLIKKHGNEALKRLTATPKSAEAPEGLSDLANRLKALGISVPANPSDGTGAALPGTTVGVQVTSDNIDALHMQGKVTDEQYRTFLNTGRLP